jgi:DNA-binding MarR family transcriptional regulator
MADTDSDIVDGLRALALPGLDGAALVQAVLLTRLGRLNEILMAAVQAEVTGPGRGGMGEAWVLTALLLGGRPYRASPTALCRASLLTSGGMTKTLRGLERDGLVRRCPDPADRRALLVELTAAGERRGRDILAAVGRHYAGLFADLEPGAADLLRALLSRLETALGKGDTGRWLRLR